MNSDTLPANICDRIFKFRKYSECRFQKLRLVSLVLFLNPLAILLGIDFEANAQYQEEILIADFLNDVYAGNGRSFNVSGSAYVEPELGLRINEHGVNQVTNPSFENNTLGWHTVGNASIGVGEGDAIAGDSYLTLDTGSAADGVSIDSQTAGMLIDALPQEADYTFSVYLRSTAAAAESVWVIVEGDDSGETAAGPFIITSEWRRVVVAKHMSAADSMMKAAILPSGNGLPASIMIDAVQLEKQKYVTTYFDGDQQGSFWHLEPHASASSRPGGLAYIDSSEFDLNLTLPFWFAMDVQLGFNRDDEMAGYPVGARDFFNIGSPDGSGTGMIANEGIILDFYSITGMLAFSKLNSRGQIRYATPQFQNGDSMRVVGAYDPETGLEFWTRIGNNDVFHSQDTSGAAKTPSRISKPWMLSVSDCNAWSALGDFHSNSLHRNLVVKQGRISHDMAVSYISGPEQFLERWWVDDHIYFWDDLPDEIPPPGRHYYWPWYDNAGGKNWILMANPAGGDDLDFDINIRRKSPNLDYFGGSAIASGQVLTPRFPLLMGGPVVATSLTGGQAVISQRSIWGHSSFEEVPGIDGDQLSHHYYWPWYDQRSPGFKNWVLVANPSSSETVTARITFTNLADGQRVGGEYDLAPGQSMAPQYPGKMGGPVEVRAWLQGGDADNIYHRRPVVASQRLLLNKDMSFNEMPGIAEADLSSHYIWTWYDQASTDVRNWVLVANPSGSETVRVRISITDLADGLPAVTEYDIAPGQSVTPEFPGRMGGPVEVWAWVAAGDWQNESHRRPVISTQRIIWKSSMGEVAGYPYDKMATQYHWSWYDQQSLEMSNWVLIANENDFPVYYEIQLSGADSSSLPGARGTIMPHQNATPTFAGLMGGPVSVSAWTGADRTLAAPVMASQRVLYRGHFNEVVGSVLE